MALGEVIRKKEHTDVKFSDKVRPKKGIASVVLAVLSPVLTGVMIMLSASAGGQGNWYLGIGGLLSMLLAVIGLVLAVRCFKMDNIYYGMPTAGAVLNGIWLLGDLALYVLGFLG